MMSKSSTDLIDVLAKRVAGTVSGNDYIDWAGSALEQGFDSPTLRILAGLPSSVWRSDADPYFTRTLEELHIEIKSDEKILRDYAKAMARRILAGEVLPETGAQLIENNVLRPLNHPEDLCDWCLLSEGRDPKTYAELSETDLNDAIRKQATALIVD